MDAKTLRIGNYVKRAVVIEELGEDEKDVLVVSSMHIRDCEYYGDSWANVPIPLTEKWLLKFGYTIDKSFPHGRIYYFKYGASLWDNGDGVMKFEYTGKSVDVKYVHQLQNIYFALTGIELTIKQ